VHTLGCRLNQAESDETLRALQARGLVAADSDGDADVVVVNTCTVTQDASKSSRKLVRRAAETGARVVVTGCYAVADPATAASLPGVAAVVANKDKDDMAAVVAALPGIVTEPVGGRSRRTIPLQLRASLAAPQVRVSQKVQTGCDEACTFCIIPETRGGLASRDADAVVDGIRAQVAGGAAEVALTGVHLGKFGAERGESGALPALVRRILDEVPELAWLRLSSVECGTVDDELLDLMASSPRICGHLHIPLQAGCDRTLVEMGRPYDLATYRGTIDRVRRALGPCCGVTTDVLVGFPGETEDDFARTLEFVEHTAFTKLHVFRYSSRPGTPAAARCDQVPESVKKDRSARLRQVGDRLAAAFNAGLVGSTVEAMVEQAGPTSDPGGGHTRPTLTATAANYVKVTTAGSAGLIGRVVEVEVATASAAGVAGELAASGTEGVRT